MTLQHSSHVMRMENRARNHRLRSYVIQIISLAAAGRPPSIKTWRSEEEGHDLLSSLVRNSHVDSALPRAGTLTLVTGRNSYG